MMHGIKLSRIVALALLVLAIVPGNPGNLVRQRAVVLAQPLLLLAGPGLLVLSRWTSGVVTPRRASPRAQQHVA